MLALFDKSSKPPPSLTNFKYLYAETPLIPLALIPSSEEEVSMFFIIQVKIKWNCSLVCFVTNFCCIIVFSFLLNLIINMSISICFYNILIIKQT